MKNSTVTNSKLRTTGFAAAPRPALWRAGVAAQLQKPNHIPAAESLRVPVIPANREYLRAVRQAELADWQRAASASDNAASRSAGRPALDHQHGETRLLARLAALALLAVTAGVAAALNFVAHWTELVNLVRQLLG